METDFPELPGLSAKLFTCPRRKPQGLGIEEVNVVAVKIAYRIHPGGQPAEGRLEPDPEGPALFEADQMLLAPVNAEFAEGLTGWTAEGGVRAEPGQKSVSLTGGAPGALVQKIEAGRGLAGRRISLSLTAKGPAGSPLPQNLVKAPTFALGFEAGVFPDDGSAVSLAAAADLPPRLAATALEISLPALGPPKAETETVWSEIALSLLAYESDLVPEKPQPDLIVIADRPPDPLSVSVNGATVLSQEGKPDASLAGLGWEPRDSGPRKTQAGTLGAPALPEDFDNAYFNGSRRDRRAAAPMGFLAPGDVVAVTRRDGAVYGFALPEAAPRLRHAWFKGSGADDPALWPHREASPRLDTLVVEIDRDRAYAVWRWAFPVAGDPPEAASADQHRLIRLSFGEA